LRLSQVCIDRPVLSTVMCLVVLIFGAIAMPRLPNRELPDIDAPKVSITSVYPGAAAEVVETSVTQPIEEAVNGIEGVKHVTSVSREQVSTVSVEFNLGRDIEAAANDVRDRVARARSKLPEEIDDPVIAKTDADASPVLWIALYGPGYDEVQLTSIVEAKILDRIAKVPGVAAVMMGGERRYSMRVWIDNRRMGAQALSIGEVVAALKRENVDIPSGRVESEDAEFTVRSLGELSSVADYEQMIVATVGGNPVRLGEIARIETGPEGERKLVRFNGQSAIGMGVVKQSKANTLDVAAAVKAEIAKIGTELDPSLTFEVAFDSSTHIRESINDVTRTIFEASLLVVFVIYIFLRSARATIIPAIAIPVSIIGAFAFLYFAGFTINTLTLMGITLAIGLVVDDAIVVLENITRWVESGVAPIDAARKGMEEISFAVVAATVSAVAVFLPLTFLTDTTGQLFREFAVTVAAALAISGFVALTFAPMLCARILRPQQTEHGIKGLLARFFEKLGAGYAYLLRPFVTMPIVAALAVAFGVVWVAGGVWLFLNADEELIPKSDRSVVMVWTEAPEGSTIDYMDRYQRQTEELLMAIPEVRRTLSVVSLGVGAPGVVNQGILFANLVTREERDRSQQEIVDALGDDLKKVPGIKAYALSPSPIRGFSSAPVELVIEGPDIFELARIADEVEREADESGVFRSFRTDLVLNKPQLEVEIDRDRAGDLGMSMRDIGTAMQILIGGLDVSTFKQDGETYNVMVQFEKERRTHVRHLLEIFVRGHGNNLLPLAAVVNTRETTTPRSLNHFDRSRAVKITSELADGYAQGEGLERMFALAESKLPPSGDYRVRFSGEAEKFYESGSALIFAYLLALLVVYLVLAAQFESFIYPVTIMVAVFMSFTGALVALEITGTTLNLFSKIGIVMLVGLVTKNSILIVEFANQLRDRGLDLVDATFDAARTRFRPILMTALATVAGIMPIALGLGAGGESRAPLGIAVVGGMIFSTILTFFVVPATYVTIERLRLRLGSGQEPVRAPMPAPEPSPVAGGQ
jgi:multidrug efflux pump